MAKGKKDSGNSGGYSAPTAPDPVRVASSTPSYTPSSPSPSRSSTPSRSTGTVSDRPAYVTTAKPSPGFHYDYPAGSLSSPVGTGNPLADYASSPGRVVGDTPIADAPARRKLRNSNLRLEPTSRPKAKAKPKAKPTAPTPTAKRDTSPSPARSQETARDKVPQTCKARPSNNKPKGGGGGSFRKFIPWC